MELTREEMRAIADDNKAHDFGYTKDEVMDFIERHRIGDKHEKAAIFFRLEDVNYHDICRCLEIDDHEGAIALVNEEWAD